MKPIFALLCLFLIVSCGPAIDVSQFHLRGEKTKATSIEMIKAEANFRFDNNLEKVDREQRHGHYYVIRWNNRHLTDKNLPLTVKLNYLQADQGRTPRVLTKKVWPKEERKVEFQVIGNDYLENGRVLAWRAELYQEERLLAHDESFLWGNN